LKIETLHQWPDNPNDAFKIQQGLQGKVDIREAALSPLHITAVDTAHDPDLDRLFAVAVTVTYPGMIEIEKSFAVEDAVFPYIPALRSFREGPVIIKALSRLKEEPDAVIFPGHGISHPRRFGMASHLGLWIDKPSIGCARKILAGEHSPPDETAGDHSSLYVANVERGYVLRSKTGVKPIFISPGHKCGLRDALDIIRRCLGEYRMPDPLRLAHLYAAKYCQSTVRKLALKNKGKQKNSPDNKTNTKITASSISLMGIKNGME